MQSDDVHTHNRLYRKQAKMTDPSPPLPSPALSSPHGASGRPPNDSDHAKCEGVSSSIT